MRRRKYLASVTGTMCIYWAIGGCSAQPRQYTLSEERMAAVGSDMDAASRYAEEYGTATVSSPLLVPMNGSGGASPFAFALGQDAQSYYAAAGKGVQAAFATDRARQTIFQGGVNILATKAGVSTTQPLGHDTSTSIGSMLQQQRMSDQVALPSRTAINVAAGDMTTQGIFNVLGDPSKYIQFGDRKMLLGVVTVGVQPGRTTQKGHVADISVIVGYQYLPARYEVMRANYRVARLQSCGISVRERVADPDSVVRLLWQADENLANRWDEELVAERSNPEQAEDRAKLKNGSAKAPENREPPAELQANPYSDCSRPLAAAVSPLSELQTIDSASRVQDAYDVSVSLSAAFEEAGIPVGVALFSKYADQLKKEARSRNTLPIVNTYSNAGGVCGFRIAPRVWASPDSSSSDPKDGRLDQQSFPALILIGMDAKDAGLKFRKDNSRGRWVPVEPALKFSEHVRWASLDGRTTGQESGHWELTSRLLEQAHTLPEAQLNASERWETCRNIAKGEYASVKVETLSELLAWEHDPKVCAQVDPQGMTCAKAKEPIKGKEEWGTVAPDVAKIAAQHAERHWKAKVGLDDRYYAALTDHLHMLRVALSGSDCVQALPSELLMPRESCSAAVEGVVPSAVRGEAGKEQELVLVGSGLAGAQVQVLGKGQVTVTHHEDSVLHLAYTIDSKAEKSYPVSFLVKDGNWGMATSPIMVEVVPPEPKKVQLGVRWFMHERIQGQASPQYRIAVLGQGLNNGEIVPRGDAGKIDVKQRSDTEMVAIFTPAKFAATSAVIFDIVAGDQKVTTDPLLVEVEKENGAKPATH